MPAKTYLIEGEDQTIQQIFPAPSKNILYKNSGQNPAQMHVITTSPTYNEETITIPASQLDFSEFPIITDRVKFTFAGKSKIELIEVY